MTPQKMSWQILDDTGALASVGHTGRWLTEAGDVVATDAGARVAAWSSERLPATFPRNWPTVFKESSVLKTLVNKTMLKGMRCRATSPPTKDDFTAAAGVPLYPLHSFSNASRLAETHGWVVVKGFLVLERSECPPGESFVALRYWWNAKEEGGPWLDFTPRFFSDGHEDRALLVESPLGEKAEAMLTQGTLTFATNLANRLIAGVRPPPSPVTPASALPAIAAQAAISAQPLPKTASPAATPSSRVDYSKWANLDVSDEDEPEPAKVDPKEKAALEKAQREQMEKEAAREQKEQVRMAIDVAAAAAAAGNTEALAGMKAAYQAAAPLDADMEQIIGALPEAAQIAARASATLAAGMSRPPESGAKEPTLRELMAMHKVEIDVEDPGLEDPREFFESAAVRWPAPCSACDEVSRSRIARTPECCPCALGYPCLHT